MRHLHRPIQKRRYLRDAERAEGAAMIAAELLGPDYTSMGSVFLVAAADGAVYQCVLTDEDRAALAADPLCVRDGSVYARRPAAVLAVAHVRPVSAFDRDGRGTVAFLPRGGAGGAVLRVALGRAPPAGHQFASRRSAAAPSPFVDDPATYLPLVSAVDAAVRGGDGGYVLLMSNGHTVTTAPAFAAVFVALAAVAHLEAHGDAFVRGVE